MRISLSTRRGLLSPPLFSFASQLPAILITPPIQPYRYFVRFKRDLFSSFPFFQSDSEIDEKEINKKKEWRISLISNFKFRVEIVYKRERGIGISFLVSFLFYFSFFFCERFNFAGRKKRFSR